MKPALNWKQGLKRYNRRSPDPDYKRGYYDGWEGVYRSSSEIIDASDEYTIGYYNGQDDNDRNYWGNWEYFEGKEKSPAPA